MRAFARKAYAKKMYSCKLWKCERTGSRAIKHKMQNAFSNKNNGNPLQAAAVYTSCNCSWITGFSSRFTYVFFLLPLNYFIKFFILESSELLYKKYKTLKKIRKRIKY